jgi:hypothetical protein
MRAIYLVLSAILLGIAVYHYKSGYVRGWSFMGHGRKRTRADDPVVFWVMLVAEIIGAAYLLIMAAF